MKLAFSTLGCPDWDLPRIAGEASALGYDAVELRVHDDGNHLSPWAEAAGLREARRIFDDAGSRVFSLMGYTRFAQPDVDERRKNTELGLRLIEVARELGAEAMRIFAGRLEGMERSDGLAKAADAIRPVARAAEAAGVALAIETHDDWCSGEIIRELVERVDVGTSLGVVWDFFNAVTGSGDTLEQSFEQLKPYIKYCHVKDGVKQPDGKWRYVVPGSGQIGVSRVVEMLRSLGFTGHLSFEWEKKWHAELEAPEEVFPAYAANMRKILA